MDGIIGSIKGLHQNRVKGVEAEHQNFLAGLGGKFNQEINLVKSDYDVKLENLISERKGAIAGVE